MAMYAKDGSRHHSASRARTHDMNAAEKPAAAPMEKAAPAGDESAGAGEDVSHMPIHEVVAKHGPAHKVEIEHNHEGGTHKKTSHHGKHKHTSEHESAQEAHEHGAMAAGAEESPDEDNETPDDANRNLSGESDEEPTPTIPGMS